MQWSRVREAIVPCCPCHFIPGVTGRGVACSVRTGISCCCPSGPAPCPCPLPAAHLLSIPAAPSSVSVSASWWSCCCWLIWGAGRVSGLALGSHQPLDAPGHSPAGPQTITRRARGWRGRKLSPPWAQSHPPHTPHPPTGPAAVSRGPAGAGAGGARSGRVCEASSWCAGPDFVLVFSLLRPLSPCRAPWETPHPRVTSKAPPPSPSHLGVGLQPGKGGLTFSP